MSDLPPLSKRRQLSHARFVLNMARDNLDLEIRDVERLRNQVVSALDRLKCASEGYARAVDELNKLTIKRKS